MDKIKLIYFVIIKRKINNIYSSNIINSLKFFTRGREK